MTNNMNRKNMIKGLLDDRKIYDNFLAGVLNPIRESENVEEAIKELLKFDCEKLLIFEYAPYKQNVEKIKALDSAKEIVEEYLDEAEIVELIDEWDMDDNANHLAEIYRKNIEADEDMEEEYKKDILYYEEMLEAYLGYMPYHWAGSFEVEDLLEEIIK